MDKGGQTVGTVTAMVFGIAAFILAVIVAFLITSTMGDAGLLTAQRNTTTQNETGGHLNATGYTLTNSANGWFVPGSITIIALWNETDNSSIATGNATVSSAGVMTNASASVWSDVIIRYSWISYSDEEQTEELLSGNFIESVDNVSEQIPTVLLVLAIVVVLVVLTSMVFICQKLRQPGEM